MSYDKNLGRVKGDAGTSYIPQITIENNKQYISFISNDGTDVPASLAKREFMSKIYRPHLDSNGNLYFTLENNDEATVNVGNVKGPMGEATIGIQVVTELPNPVGLTTDQKRQIYVIDDGEAYLGAAVYDETKRDFVYLESMIQLDEYAKKVNVYDKQHTYSKEQIDSLLCNIEDKINTINEVMGDTGSIIILDDGA